VNYTMLEEFDDYKDIRRTYVGDITIAWIGVQGYLGCIMCCLQAIQDHESNGRTEAIKP
jgi:hypothetical protein